MESDLSRIRTEYTLSRQRNAQLRFKRTVIFCLLPSVVLFFIHAPLAEVLDYSGFIACSLIEIALIAIICLTLCSIVSGKSQSRRIGWIILAGFATLASCTAYVVCHAIWMKSESWVHNTPTFTLNTLAERTPKLPDLGYSFQHNTYLKIDQWNQSSIQWSGANDVYRMYLLGDESNRSVALFGFRPSADPVVLAFSVLTTRIVDLWSCDVCLGTFDRSGFPLVPFLEYVPIDSTSEEGNREISVWIYVICYVLFMGFGILPISHDWLVELRAELDQKWANSHAASNTASYGSTQVE